MASTLRLFGMALLVALSASAGSIFITLRVGAQPLANVEVTVTCANRKPPVRTGADGSFRIFVQENGRCTLSIPYNGQRPEAVFSSIADPVEYFFNLVGDPKSGYRLEPATRH